MNKLFGWPNYSVDQLFDLPNYSVDQMIRDDHHSVKMVFGVSGFNLGITNWLRCCPWIVGNGLRRHKVI